MKTAEPLSSGGGTEGKVLILPRLLFRLDSAALSPSATESLDAFSSFLKKYSKATLRIEGHADRVGGRKDLNLKISQRRAEAVRKYLATRGVASFRMETRWLGDERPLHARDDAANRCVDIQITGGLPEGWTTRAAPVR